MAGRRVPNPNETRTAIRSSNLLHSMTTNITIGEKYGPAMEMTDQATADDYFEQCVTHCMRHGRSRAEAESIEKQNLGYYAGYYGSETRERVERLFKCSHPVFGAIGTNGQPTAKEAISAGLVAAKSGVKMAAKVFAV